MRPKPLILAILVGTLLTPALQVVSNQPTQRSGVDPVGPPAYQGEVVLRELTLEESTQRAGLIIVGRVTRLQSRAVTRSIVTDVTVQIEQQIKGPIPALTSVTFTKPGGHVGGEQLFVGGQPEFVNGERVLLFLHSATDLHLLQMYTSRYTLAGSEAIQPEGNKRLAISDVEGRMAVAAGRSVTIGATSNTIQPSAFTLYCTSWMPDQFPVPYAVNAGANPGLPSRAGSGAATGLGAYYAVVKALMMWQSLPDSGTAFTISGPSSTWGMAPAQGAYSYAGVDGENTLAWADLDIVQGGGQYVIGLNFCSVDTSTGRRHDSDVFLSNNAAWTWDSVPEDGISGGSLSTKAVLGHELGHGLGLDHSGDQNAIMYPAIPQGSDKVVGADDQAGASSLYPLSGGAPGAPSALSAVISAGSSTALQWTAGGGTRFAYQVERAVANCDGTFVAINTVAATATSYVDNNYGFGLSAGTYCYRVKALGVGGDSAYSNLAPAVTAIRNVNSDFSGDKRSDAGIVRATTGPNSLWYSVPTGGGPAFQIYFGVSGDIPVPGDYDGDGKTDGAIWRPSTGLWYGPRTGAASIVMQLVMGQDGDIPVPCDYNGDGAVDPAIFRPSTGNWYGTNAAGSTVVLSTAFGGPNDIPVPADFDGDGKCDAAIMRAGAGPGGSNLWYAPQSGGGIFQVFFGLVGDIPAPADYDGDGRADAVIYRPSTGLWYGPRTGAGTIVTQGVLGQNGDIPVPGDYDGNGATDPAIYRPSTGLFYGTNAAGSTVVLNTNLGVVGGDIPTGQRPHYQAAYPFSLPSPTAVGVASVMTGATATPVSGVTSGAPATATPASAAQRMR